MVPQVEFCGELYEVRADRPVVIGRDGDVAIDDNRYLHRRFLEVGGDGSLWWLSNVGSLLTATVSDEAGLLQAWLAPGARLPLVFQKTVVLFSAGPTTYEVNILLDEAPFVPVAMAASEVGSTTIGRVSFTPDQQRLVLALCEPVLRGGTRGAGTIPSSAAAAARLGWTLTRFNRKLDNVCEKLSRAGIRGLHGAPDRLATSRRARLVEYALAARLVTTDDLALLVPPSDDKQRMPAPSPRPSKDARVRTNQTGVSRLGPP